MLILIQTVRSIPDKDLDKWLKFYREQMGYPIDIEKIKTEKTAAWTSKEPALATEATTKMTVGWEPLQILTDD